MSPVRSFHQLSLIAALTMACPMAVLAADESVGAPPPAETIAAPQTTAPAATSQTDQEREDKIRLDQASEDKRGTWTLLIENDVLSNSDRHYTNGLNLSWLSASDDVPDFAAEISSWVPFLLAPDGKRRLGFNFGQSMFTPGDIKIRDAQPDDRPWAGYLYAGMALLSETPTRLDTLEVDIGVVGPASFAEQTQKEFHQLIGSPEPQGWNNQLKNEPTIAIIWERKWREEVLRLSDPGSHFGVDLTPMIGAALGNVYTYATTGLALRIGEDLPSDFGPPRVRPSLPGSEFFDLQDKFGWYLFASAEGRAVARNIFLDGNTFEDSASVDKLPFVADFQVGFAVMFRRVRLTVAQVYRTREFETQNEPDRFSAVSLSFKF